MKAANVKKVAKLAASAYGMVTISYICNSNSLIETSDLAPETAKERTGLVLVQSVQNGTDARTLCAQDIDPYQTIP